MLILSLYSFFFFFNDTATTEIYTLSLHDALPISRFRASPADGRPSLRWCDSCGDRGGSPHRVGGAHRRCGRARIPGGPAFPDRSEEHTSELQSQSNLVCRLLLEKKKNKKVCNDV